MNEKPANTRDQALIAIRPEISNIDQSIQVLPEEAFQNTVLRPILKLQNPLLLAMMRNYVHQQAKSWGTQSPEAQKSFIQQALQKDLALKHSMAGIVIGMFSENEMQVFVSHEKDLRKRITQMLTQRILDQIGLLSSVR